MDPHPVQFAPPARPAVPGLPATQQQALPIAAWTATLLVSLLPNILFQELTGSIPAWLFWSKLVALAGLFGLSVVWKQIRPLRQYFLIFFVLYVVEWLFGWIGDQPWWASRFGAGEGPFVVSMLGQQLRRVGVALVMVAVLLALKRRRSRFFLVIGQLDAPVEPVRGLIDGPMRWTRLGPILSVLIGLGLLVFLFIAGRPPLGALAGVLPLLPAVLLFSAMNAFGEEMNYRASLLSGLDGVVSKRQAMLLLAAYFGLGHYYGVPYGVAGVLMAGFLGWLLSKSMIETRGFFWPWFIHFVQDVLIFSLMAIGSIAAGGK